MLKLTKEAKKVSQGEEALIKIFNSLKNPENMWCRRSKSK